MTRPPAYKAITTIAHANAAIDRCRRGAATIVSSGGSFILVESSGPERRVGKRVAPLFRDWLNQHGARDGLFAGFSQSSEKPTA